MEHSWHSAAFTVPLNLPASHDTQTPRAPRRSPGKHSGVGDGVGLCVGLGVGLGVGAGEGAAVGLGVGIGVGLGVGTATHALWPIPFAVHLPLEHASHLVTPASDAKCPAAHATHCTGAADTYQPPALLPLPLPP